MQADVILPELLVGSCPRSRGDIDQLKRDYGVTAVLNLQTEADFQYLGIDWPDLESYYQAAGLDNPIGHFFRQEANATSLCGSLTCSTQPGQRGNDRARQQRLLLRRTVLPAMQAAPTPAFRAGRDSPAACSARRTDKAHGNLFSSRGQCPNGFMDRTLAVAVNAAACVGVALGVAVCAAVRAAAHALVRGGSKTSNTGPAP